MPRKFSFESLERSLAEIRSAGTTVAGIVLNRVRRRKGGKADEERPSPPSDSHKPMVKLRRVARSG